jgi:uncharacterized protein HemY
MKNKPLPDSHEKRKLLYEKKLPPEELGAVGERFLEAGRVYEAAEFFRKASYRQGWARLRSLAVEQGDSTLLEMALKGDPVGDPRPLWLALGKRALELGKYSHAARAFRKAGDEDGAKGAEELLKEVFGREQA